MPSFRKKRKEGVQTFDDDVVSSREERRELDRCLGSRNAVERAHAGLTIGIAGK